MCSTCARASPAALRRDRARPAASSKGTAGWTETHHAKPSGQSAQSTGDPSSDIQQPNKRFVVPATIRRCVRSGSTTRHEHAQFESKRPLEGAMILSVVASALCYPTIEPNGPWAVSPRIRQTLSMPRAVGCLTAWSTLLDAHVPLQPEGCVRKRLARLEATTRQGNERAIACRHIDHSLAAGSRAVIERRATTPVRRPVGSLV